MMNLKNLKYYVCFFALSLFAISCEEDPFGPGPGGGTDEAPTTSLFSDPGFVLGSATVAPGEVFKVKLNGLAGTTEMEAVRVLEDGVLVDASRITFDGAQANANPKLLFGAERLSFTWEIGVAAHTTSGTHDYSFEIVDVNNLTERATVSITVEEIITPPDFTIQNSGMITVAPGSLLSLPLQATAGSSKMTFVGVAEGADFIEDLSRMYYGDLQTNFSSNPHPLPDADSDVLDQMIFIRVPEDAGAYVYRIFIIDENAEGSGSFVDIDVTVENVATGTPVDFLFGTLLNSAGDVGTGGLDLDEGIGTGSNDPMAEIKDDGIDLDQPVATNWRKQIGGANGSELKQLVPGMNGLSETFTFNTIMFKEQLAMIYDNGVPFTLTNANNQLVSNSVNPGDLFIVKNGENYYIISIAEVNETDGNNDDNYVIDIMR